MTCDKRNRITHRLSIDTLLKVKVLNLSGFVDLPWRLQVSVSVSAYRRQPCLVNTANLVQYSGNIANPTLFGQPGARFSQVFGSGGPRAFQFGARVSF